MLTGSVILVVGLILLRMSQEALGRMYFSLTTIGIAEDHTSGVLRILADIRGDDEKKKRKGLIFIGIGILIGLIGAAIIPL